MVGVIPGSWVKPPRSATTRVNDKRGIARFNLRTSFSHAIERFGFAIDPFRVSAAARADLLPGHFPDPSHGILLDDAPRCGRAAWS